MKTKLSFFLLLGFATSLAVLPANATGLKLDLPNAAFVVGDGDCSSWSNNWDGLPVYRSEEQRTIPRSSVGKLSIHPPRNGGVQVEGWDRDDISVKLCKSAADDNEQAARSRLDSIKLSINGGDVTAVGPDDGDRWGVQFVVRVPNNITMELAAHNGPISLRGVNGIVDAKTVNGPISLRKCSGTITVDVSNGPVSLSDSSGKIHVSAQNGPVSVQLADRQWTGEGLDASTHNGPLTLKIPSGYQSGVEVISDGHSPFSCQACAEANRTWDNDGSRKARLGTPGAQVVVRLSTVNGPVSIHGTMD